MVHTYYFSKETLSFSACLAGLEAKVMDESKSELWGIFGKSESERSLNFSSVYDKQLRIIRRKQCIERFLGPLLFLTRKAGKLIPLKLLDPSVKRGISVRMLWRQKVAKKRRRTRWVRRGFFVIPFGPNGSCRKPRLTDGSRKLKEKCPSWIKDWLYAYLGS